MSDTEVVPRNPDRADRDPPLVDERLADELRAHAHAQCAELLGPNGLLPQVTKAVLERALREELTVHLGYDKATRPGMGRATPATASLRNGC